MWASGYLESLLVVLADWWEFNGDQGRNLEIVTEEDSFLADGGITTIVGTEIHCDG